MLKPTLRWSGAYTTGATRAQASTPKLPWRIQVLKSLGLDRGELEGGPAAQGDGPAADSVAGVRKRPASVNAASRGPSKSQKGSQGELPPGGLNLRPGSSKTLTTGGLEICAAGSTASASISVPVAACLGGGKPPLQPGKVRGPPVRPMIDGRDAAPKRPRTSAGGCRKFPPGNP